MDHAALGCPKTLCGLDHSPTPTTPVPPTPLWSGGTGMVERPRLSQIWPRGFMWEGPSPQTLAGLSTCSQRRGLQRTTIVVQQSPRTRAGTPAVPATGSSPRSRDRGGPMHGGRTHRAATRQGTGSAHRSLDRNGQLPEPLRRSAERWGSKSYFTSSWRMTWKNPRWDFRGFRAALRGAHALTIA